MPPREGTYGLLAEFDTPGDLIRAARQAHQDGWRRMDCYTPYPVEEAAEAIGFHRNKVPLVTLVGGLMGLTAMFLLFVRFLPMIPMSEIRMMLPGAKLKAKATVQGDV